MSLTGVFERSLDEKARIAIPKKLRDLLIDQVSDSIYLAPGRDGCLDLYSQSAFSTLANRFNHLSTAHTAVRQYQRLFYSQAEEMQFDKQGRIRIPERLMMFAQLGREVTLVGNRDHLEVWSRESWEKLLQDHAHEFDQIASEAFLQNKE